jgi:hypothetical protein
MSLVSFQQEEASATECKKDRQSVASRRDERDCVENIVQKRNDLQRHHIRMTWASRNKNFFTTILSIIKLFLQDPAGCNIESMRPVGPPPLPCCLIRASKDTFKMLTLSNIQACPSAPRQSRCSIRKAPTPEPRGPTVMAISLKPPKSMWIRP